MNPPLISIIVPVYNVEQYLDECVESLVQQTYQNLEIILVDDGSLDCSPQKCDEWMQKDSRVKVLHKPNGGSSDARNAGIEASKGKYLMFVDSDDFISNNTVDELYDLIISTDADLACGGFFKYFENGASKEIYNSIISQTQVTISGNDMIRLLLDSKIDCSSCCKLYRRTTIADHRFAKGRSNEDMLFLFYLYSDCYRSAYTAHRYYYYRDTPGSVTGCVSVRTMDTLKNALEMKEFVYTNSIPINGEMKNYLCRTCLELGYAIQREKAQKKFPDETLYVKRHIKKHLAYIIMSPHYNWRDIAHMLINLYKL